MNYSIFLRKDENDEYDKGTFKTLMCNNGYFIFIHTIIFIFIYEDSDLSFGLLAVIVVECNVITLFDNSKKIIRLIPVRFQNPYSIIKASRNIQNVTETYSYLSLIFSYVIIVIES